MILGIGTDVVGRARFEATLARTPTVLDRLLSSDEIASPVVVPAARFAAKEAMAKALGATGGPVWHECEVVDDGRGGVTYALSGGLADRAAALGVRRWHLVLDAGPGLVTAFCVLEGRAGPGS